MSLENNFRIAIIDEHQEDFTEGWEFYLEVHGYQVERVERSNEISKGMNPQMYIVHLSLKDPLIPELKKLTEEGKYVLFFSGEDVGRYYGENGRWMTVGHLRGDELIKLVGMAEREERWARIW